MLLFRLSVESVLSIELSTRREPGGQLPHSALPPAEMGTAQQEIPVTFWDPSQDSLWGVYEGNQCTYVYCYRQAASDAAKDIGGQLREILNQDLWKFWFDNPNLNLIR